jgi:hypothetical protein
MPKLQWGLQQDHGKTGGESPSKSKTPVSVEPVDDISRTAAKYPSLSTETILRLQNDALASENARLTDILEKHLAMTRDRLAEQANLRMETTDLLNRQRLFSLDERHVTPKITQRRSNTGWPYWGTIPRPIERQVAYATPSKKEPKTPSPPPRDQEIHANGEDEEITMVHTSSLETSEPASLMESGSPPEDQESHANSKGEEISMIHTSYPETSEPSDLMGPGSSPPHRIDSPIRLNLGGPTRKSLLKEKLIAKILGSSKPDTDSATIAHVHKELKAEARKSPEAVTVNNTEAVSELGTITVQSPEGTVYLSDEEDEQ